MRFCAPINAPGQFSPTIQGWRLWTEEEEEEGAFFFFFFSLPVYFRKAENDLS